MTLKPGLAPGESLPSDMKEELQLLERRICAFDLVIASQRGRLGWDPQPLRYALDELLRHVREGQDTLDALVGEGEWVAKWDSTRHGDFTQHRADEGGSRVQWYNDRTDEWTDDTGSSPYAYRKGREVALAGLNAKVTELVEAVLAFPWPLWKSCDNCTNAPYNERIRNLAKALKS